MECFVIDLCITARIARLQPYAELTTCRNISRDITYIEGKVIPLIGGGAHGIAQLDPYLFIPVINGEGPFLRGG